MPPLASRVRIADAYGAEAWGHVEGYGWGGTVIVALDHSTPGARGAVRLPASYFAEQANGTYLVDMQALGLKE